MLPPAAAVAAAAAGSASRFRPAAVAVPLLLPACCSCCFDAFLLQRCYSNTILLPERGLYSAAGGVPAAARVAGLAPAAAARPADGCEIRCGPASGCTMSARCDLHNTPAQPAEQPGKRRQMTAAGSRHTEAAWGGVGCRFSCQLGEYMSIQVPGKRGAAQKRHSERCRWSPEPGARPACPTAPGRVCGCCSFREAGERGLWGWGGVVGALTALDRCLAGGAACLG